MLPVNVTAKNCNLSNPFFISIIQGRKEKQVQLPGVSNLIYSWASETRSSISKWASEIIGPSSLVSLN